VSDQLKASIWTRARDRILIEFQHAPVGTIGAVVALLDVLWRLIGGEWGSRQAAATGFTETTQLHPALPEIAPALEFFFFQAVIAFIWHRVNFWFSRASRSIRIVVALLSTVLSAYLTSLNAFYFAIFEIESEGRHYTIFAAFWIIGFALSIILVTVLSIERNERHVRTRDVIFRLASTVLPMAVVFFGACIFFEGAFEDRLQPIWAARIHQP
jgi:hypothetical protein